MQPISPSLSYQTPYYGYSSICTSSSSSLAVPQYLPMPSPQSLKSFDGSSVPKPSRAAKALTPRADEIDLRRLILVNLPMDLVREYLELYLEHLSGEAEIERIDYSNLEDTTVMVTFQSALDFADVRRRHATRSKLNDSEISLVEVTAPATVMIRNLPSDVSRDVLELYFSNRRRSDGGQVTDVTFENDHQHALVTFADHQNARRVINREHSIHGHRLDVRMYYKHMGIEPFIDASNVGKQPDPIRYQASSDSRYLFLLKHRPLLADLIDELKSLHGSVHCQDEDFFEVTYQGSRSTVKHRLQWTDAVQKSVEQFLNNHLMVHTVPWNNRKLPAVTAEQLADLSAKDNTRLVQLAPTASHPDHIVVTALKDQLDRALHELTDMLTTSTEPQQNIPLNDAVYRSKPVVTTRDPRVDNHRSSVIMRGSPARQSTRSMDGSARYPVVDDYLDELRLYQLDLLSMRFIELARRTYQNLSIHVDRSGRRVHMRGPSDQVKVCKNYFQSILHGMIKKHYKLKREMAIFLSNPDTVEVIIGNLASMDHVCAYEIERPNNDHRRGSRSPISDKNGLTTSVNSDAPTAAHGQRHHKLVLYSLTRDHCDRAYEMLRHDIRVSSIMLDKDDRRCLTSDSWHGFVRDLYSSSGGGFRRRRVLLQVKQNQLTFVGFEQDMNGMRKRVNEYFVEKAISFYESD